MIKFRFTMFMLTTFLVLALSAMSVVPALADDSIPPPIETPAAQTPPTDAVIEVMPSTESSVVEPITAVDDSVSQKESVTALLPEGTELVVVNEAGETIPLASTKAAQTIELADPIWCPTGVAPKISAGGCSVSFGTLKDLITGFVPTKNGVIWIEKNADTDSSNAALLINGGLGGNWVSAANFSLTLKGGWNGCNPGCVSTVNTNTPSIFNQSFSITNWNGDITLSDITFTGVAAGSVSNNAVLNIDTNKKITLTNVVIAQNTGLGTVNGAWLDNNDGSVPSDVVITNSVFSLNKNNGLIVYSDGAITSSNLVVNSNGGAGAYLDNDAALSAKAITLTGNSNQVKFNGLDGLVISSKGAITLNSIGANNNGGVGVLLDNTTSGPTSPQNITLTGNTIVNNNAGSGLYVQTYGAIVLGNVTADNNGVSGVVLRNYFNINDIPNIPSSITPKPVTLTGTVNEFNNNATEFGLYVLSLGTITLNSVQASDNGKYGLYAYNSSTGAVGSVTLNGTSRLDNNLLGGLVISSKGAIKLNNIEASSNGKAGALLQNTASGVASPQSITINGLNSFNDNGDDGLIAASYGVITTSNLTASGNGQNGGTLGYGVWLDNCDVDAISLTCKAVTAKGVTMNGTNTFNNNRLNGLLVQSLGVIKANNVTASNNSQNGAILNNGWEIGFFGVTLTGSNAFENNHIEGLDINSNGVISLNNISASGNVTGNGLYIHTENIVKGPPNITMTGINTFNDNGGRGLWILSNGLVTLNNVTANGNGGEGAYVDNFINTPYRWSPFPANTINLLGVNNFNGNGSDGLFLHTYGGINITKLTADDNAGDGIEGYSIEKGITISCGSMTNNTGVGWRLYAWTTITLKGVFTIGNIAGPFVNTGGSLVTVRICP